MTGTLLFLGGLCIGLSVGCGAALSIYRNLGKESDAWRESAVQWSEAFYRLKTLSLKHIETMKREIDNVSTTHKSTVH